MIQEIEWSDHASDSLKVLGLPEYEVEKKLQVRRRWRKNRGKGDWRGAIDVPEFPHTLEIIFDHPVRGDDLRAKVVTLWPLP
jgi:hypothetical protein